MIFLQKKNIVLFIKILLAFSLNGQESNYQKDIELGIGCQLMSFDFEKNNNYFSGMEKNLNGLVNFYVQLSYINHMKKDDNFFYKLGVGISREYISIFPTIPITQTGLSNDTSLTIVEMANLEYQLRVPLNISYALRRFKNGHGVQLSFGVEPRVKIIDRGTGTNIVRDFISLDNYGEAYEEEFVYDIASQYYSDAFRPFSLFATFGVGMKFPETGASIGYKLNYMVISPLKIKTKFTSRFGITVFGIYPLFNIK